MLCRKQIVEASARVHGSLEDYRAFCQPCQILHVPFDGVVFLQGLGNLQLVSDLEEIGIFDAVELLINCSIGAILCASAMRDNR
jgi:hypothetical protein